jgi:hypothetical protein
METIMQTDFYIISLKMPRSTWRLLALCAVCWAGAAWARAADQSETEAPSVAWALDPKVMAAAHSAFLTQARAAFLDRTGKAPLPSTEFPFPPPFAAAFAKDIAEIKSLAAEAAYVQAGRGPEDMTTYAEMVVLVATRLGIEPGESVLPLYHDRVRPPGKALTPQEEQGFSELTAAVKDPGFQHRYLYVEGLFGKPALANRSTPSDVITTRRGRGKRRRQVVVVPAPPEPQGPSHSVLDTVDWKRAEELAAAAADGAEGWNRRTQRRRRGRCYEWVRMALEKTGLWRDSYRAEVTSKGDSRRPRRAYSFAWAMNKLELRGDMDPFAERKAPLRRLDLRVDPLVKGSIVVFDRKICGFNNKSGHIEVITSVDPLRASSYKFHEVKIDCLIKASNEGKVHVYVPQRLDPYPPAPEAPASAPVVAVDAAPAPTVAASIAPAVVTPVAPPVAVAAPAAAASTDPEAPTSAAAPAPPAAPAEPAASPSAAPGPTSPGQAAP